MVPLLIKPIVGLVLVAAAAAVWLAWLSPAYPVALSGLPPILIAVTGSNPLPKGGVSILFAVWMVLGVALALFHRKPVLPLRLLASAGVVLSVALLAWMLLRLEVSPAELYGMEKVQLYVAGNIVLLVAGLVIGWRRTDLKLLIGLSFVVATSGALVVLFQFLTGTAETVLPDRFSISEEENPILLARAAATALIIGVYLILASAGASARVWVVAALPVLAVVLVATGSRGPVIGGLSGLALLLAFGAGTSSARRRLLLVLLAMLGCLALVPMLVPDAAVSRSLSIFSDAGAGLESNGRTELWLLAYDTFGANPLGGIGPGGFSAIQIAELYPHNLFLEVAVELGLVGLLLTLALLGDAGWRLLRTWSAANGEARLLSSLIIALFVTALVNSLFSGALPTNEEVWLWAGVAIGLDAQRRAGVARASTDWPEAAAIPRFSSAPP